jgi:hypothetical protein
MLYRSQNLIDVAVDRDLRPHVGDPAVCADHKGRALNPHTLPSVHILLDKDPERITHFGIDVGEEAEWQVNLGFKLGLGFDRVAADPDDNNAFALELRVGVAKLRRFGRSTRGVGTRIEKDHQRRAGE